MKVGIVGSRDFGLENSATHGYHMFIKGCVEMLGPQDYVVSGGADGADHWAELYAMRKGVSRIIHEADWPKHGRYAGPIRNRLIVRDADCILAFFTNKRASKGTLNCVTQARELGVPVYEFDALTEVEPEWYDTWTEEMRGLTR